MATTTAAIATALTSWRENAPSVGSASGARIRPIFDRVTFSYGPRDILAEASLEMPAGSITVLTGPSGAGKTTLIDLVLGLHRPQRGRILIDGVDLAEIDLQAWRRQVGYVPQELILFHDSVFENLTLGDPAYGEREVEEALALAGASAFVAQLAQGVATVVGNKGARLSGGQRQRIALARALIRKPSLLILDEVTSALDPESELAICHNILALRERTTVLAVTHRPAFLHIATRIYQLGDGKARQIALPDASPGLSPAATTA
jgi:ATP-binding cassette subfamily C protein